MATSVVSSVANLFDNEHDCRQAVYDRVPCRINLCRSMTAVALMVVALGTLVDTQCQFHAPCVCDARLTEIVCRNVGFEQVPRLPTSVTKL